MPTERQIASAAHARQVRSANARQRHAEQLRDHGWTVYPPSPQREPLVTVVLDMEATIAVPVCDLPESAFGPDGAIPTEAATAAALDLLHEYLDELPARHGAVATSRNTRFSHTF